MQGVKAALGASLHGTALDSAASVVILYLDAEGARKIAAGTRGPCA